MFFFCFLFVKFSLFVCLLNVPFFVCLLNVPFLFVCLFVCQYWFWSLQLVLVAEGQA
jgi:hypothetical protein